MSQPAPGAPPHLPNPLTPLAFLPPEIGFELTVSTYVLVGSLAVLIWDILNNLGSDFILLTKFRVRFPTLVYFSSRILNLAYFILSAILNTVPTGNCGPLRKAASWLFVAAVSSTAALFLLRVTAMYDRNPYITAFFTAVWLLVPIGSGTLPFGISAMKLGPTNYCVSTTPAWFIVFTAITPLINDTLVFIALTGRLVQTAMDRPQSLIQRIRTIFLGTTLPAFSKAMLLDGQSYYLLTVGLRIFNFILLYAPGIPTVYRHTAGVPFIVVIHISACRVFRNTKFGIFRATTTSEVSRDARGHSSGMNWMKGVTTSKSSIAFASKSLAPSSTATVTGHHLGEHGEGVELQGRHGNGVMVSIQKHADGFDQDTSFDLKSSESFPQDPRMKSYEV